MIYEKGQYSELCCCSPDFKSKSLKFPPHVTSFPLSLSIDFTFFSSLLPSKFSLLEEMELMDRKRLEEENAQSHLDCFKKGGNLFRLSFPSLGFPLRTVRGPHLFLFLSPSTSSSSLSFHISKRDRFKKAFK